MLFSLSTRFTKFWFVRNQRYIASKKGGVQTDEEENILSDIETDELIHQRRFYEWFCFFTNITRLIDLLVTSGGKFIFSCRASATKDASSNKSDEEYLKQNREIYNNVLDYFRKKGIRLWVARFSTKNMSFAEKLINNGETEIMITNFEIQDFTPKNRGVVETMSYVDFMQDIDKYLVK